MRLARYFILAAAAALLVSAAAAPDRRIGQKGRMFSQENVTVPRGVAVLFVNDDTVPHNIMSLTPDNEFDTGSQMPGSVTPVTFDRAGIVAVVCAIHPRMHMTITVTP
jgi:plastocyanin